MTFVEFGQSPLLLPRLMSARRWPLRRKERKRNVLSRLKWLGLGRRVERKEQKGRRTRWGPERYRALTWSPCGYRIPYEVGLVLRSKGPTRDSLNNLIYFGITEIGKSDVHISECNFSISNFMSRTSRLRNQLFCVKCEIF